MPCLLNNRGDSPVPQLIPTPYQMSSNQNQSAYVQNNTHFTTDGHWWLFFLEKQKNVGCHDASFNLACCNKNVSFWENREAVWFSICIHLPLCSYWLHRSTGEHIIIHGWKDQRGQSSVIIQLDCQSPSSGNKSFLVDANDCLDSRLRHIQWYTRHQSSLKHVLRWVKNWDTTQFPWIHHHFPYDQLIN